MRQLSRSIPSVAVLMLAAGLLLPAASGHAGVPPLPLPKGSPTPTPTQTQPPPPPPAPTPTETAPPAPGPQPTPKPTSHGTPTPTPKPGGSGHTGGSGGGSGGGGSSGGSGGGSSSGGSSGGGGSTSSNGIPILSSSTIARDMREWLTRPKSPAHSTAELLQLIAARLPAGRTPAFANMRPYFGHFPIIGYTWWQDDYGAPRCCPYNPHEGTDLFAPKGTPVIAVDDGFIWKIGNGGTGGNSIWLRRADGKYYWYGHLDHFAPGVHPGLRVHLGQLIAFVGDTGNAQGTPPHVHFEWHPSGTRDTVNPKPLVDSWLFADLARLTGNTKHLRAAESLSPLAGARWGALIDLMNELPAAQPPLWVSGLGAPGGSSLAYADLALDDLFSTTGVSSLAPVGAQGAGGVSLSMQQNFDPLAAFTASLQADNTTPGLGN